MPQEVVERHPVGGNCHWIRLLRLLGVFHTTTLSILPPCHCDLALGFGVNLHTHLGEQTGRGYFAWIKAEQLTFPSAGMGSQ